ncbi:glycerol dehydratase reactivation factor, small subunit [Thermincola potens JR]|uniref:Glycerol dehydratase reactivation factor, small subunit n=2 Tax=Thermincola TaxID=278993 RepID=D5XBU7_THEPJ|nr:glycerol dehydratase reactivation factor, small subunit [Thermincola potens JR]
MNMEQELERRPVISLLRPRGLDADRKFSKLVSAIKAGMEEESVPWLEGEEEGALSAAELALRGARQSRLGVGIGIDPACSIAVYFNRGENSEPLFLLSADWASEKVARLVGTNAARLVKKIPFKDLAGLGHKQ